MILNTLRIENLRNHNSTEVNFCKGLNILSGKNGSGKTTVLEAISISSLSRSFLPTSDAQLIRSGTEQYQVHAKAQTELGVPYSVHIVYSSGSRKQISSSIGESLSPKDIIGELPVVILSPDFKAITFGAPEDRRRFLDALLSQCNKRYVEEALNLKRILKQRNDLLNAAKKSGYCDGVVLDLWTDSLIQTATEITLRRSRFIEDFTPYFTQSYQQVSGAREEVSLQYIAKSLGNAGARRMQDKNAIISAYQSVAKTLREEEMRRGTTLFGPQKDDLYFEINGGAARDYASQGQHKSLLIALKYAEYEYLYEQKDEIPILLYDDIFSELDEERTKNVLQTVVDTGAQTFITATESEKIVAALPQGVEMKLFYVHNGLMTEV